METCCMNDKNRQRLCKGLIKTEFWIPDHVRDDKDARGKGQGRG